MNYLGLSVYSVVGGALIQSFWGNFVTKKQLNPIIGVVATGIMIPLWPIYLLWLSTQSK